MTTNEQTTLQDRCARCDCAESGAPDAQALLAEARAQVELVRERLEISNKCRLANEAELIRADMTIGSLRSEADQARRERDVRETLVQQYRAQHDREAQRRGCPYCTCDVCAAAMRRTAVLP
jgi:hypothetical protein